MKEIYKLNLLFHYEKVRFRLNLVRLVETKQENKQSNSALFKNIK